MVVVPVVMVVAMVMPMADRERPLGLRRRGRKEAGNQTD